MAYTTIDDPSAYFHTQLYTGAGGTQAITNDANAGNFKPDWVWLKERANVSGHKVYDSSRGVEQLIQTNLTSPEETKSTGVTAFNTDGFTCGGDGGHNQASQTYVAWQWKANGGTTASNTDGSITSTVQANTDAGFSIVTWAGTGVIGTVGHGLGVAPKVVIVKARTNSTQWAIFHKDGFTSDDNYLIFTTGAIGSQVGLWNNQYPSSTVFGVSSDAWLNGGSTNYLAYCFAEKQGYSKFGTYYGNALADGEFVYLGFKPAFVMVKVLSDPNYGWVIADNKRGPFNQNDPSVYANSTAAETTNDFKGDFLSNGFKLHGTTYPANSGGTNTFAYFAWAENPFVTSTGVPATAR